MPTHDQHTLVPYRDDQLFDLVADVASYPQFLPWCLSARLRSRTTTELVADLTIGFGPFRESFTSRVKLDRPRGVLVNYENGPFKYLHNSWGFTPTAQGCRVDFHVDFEFRSRLLSGAIGVVFQEAVRRMVAAFMKRARDIYGPPGRLPAVSAPVPNGAVSVKTEA